MKGTNSDVWAQYYLDGLIGVCKSFFQNDQSLWTSSVSENGTISYIEPTDIINSMCLNNCSNNGECLSGKFNSMIKLDQFLFECF